MNSLTITNHAALRMGQRAIAISDAELIASIGTEVDGGYLVRDCDYLHLEQILKSLLDDVRRLKGKRLVVADGTIVTAYHCSERKVRKVLRASRDRGMYHR